MSLRRVRALGLLVASLSLWSCSRPCSSGNALIDEYYGIRIRANVGAILGIDLADACADGSVKACVADSSGSRWHFAPGCAQYLVIPSRGGLCRIDVLLADGTHVIRAIDVQDHRAECNVALDLRPSNPGDSLIEIDGGVSDGAADASTD